MASFSNFTFRYQIINFSVTITYNFRLCSHIQTPNVSNLDLKLLHTLYNTE